MKIGELANRSGCDVQTVRYYEREGLLDAPARDASGYRRYAQRHLERVQFIRHCRSLDIALSDVRRFQAFSEAPDASCAQVNALLDEHIGKIRLRLRALEALEKQLVTLRAQCDGDASHPCAILESFMAAATDHACAWHAAPSGR